MEKQRRFFDAAMTAIYLALAFSATLNVHHAPLYFAAAVVHWWAMRNQS